MSTKAQHRTHCTVALKKCTVIFLTYKKKFVTPKQSHATTQVFIYSSYDKHGKPPRAVSDMRDNSSKSETARKEKGRERTGRISSEFPFLTSSQALSCQSQKKSLLIMCDVS